jgi:hypothetical protein
VCACVRIILCRWSALLGEENQGLALALRAAVWPTSVQRTSPPVAGNQIPKYVITFMYTINYIYISIYICNQNHIKNWGAGHGSGAGAAGTWTPDARSSRTDHYQRERERLSERSRWSPPASLSPPPSQARSKAHILKRQHEANALERQHTNTLQRQHTGADSEKSAQKLHRRQSKVSKQSFYLV